jgi:hypothetical protein
VISRRLRDLTDRTHSLSLLDVESRLARAILQLEDPQ